MNKPRKSSLTLSPKKLDTRFGSLPSDVSRHVFCHTCFKAHMQTNTQRLSAWESGPLDFLGPHPAFAAAAPLSRGNELLSEGRAHNGTSHNATFTGPHTAGGTISQSDTVRPRPPWTIINCCPGRRWGNNNQLPRLSDFSSCF